MPHPYRADCHMHRATRTAHLPPAVGRSKLLPRAADPVLMELARGEGRCQEVAGKDHGPPEASPWARPAGMPYVRINRGIELAGGEQWVMN